MTPQQIRDEISADQTLLSLAHLSPPDTAGIAASISAARTEPFSKMTSARGVAEQYAGGPVAAEAVLLKLEAARDSMLSSNDTATKVLGSLLRRQLAFLASDGLDFGSAALRGMLDQFVTAGILTSEEANNLKRIGERHPAISEFEVRRAIFSDDGTLLV